MHRRRWPRIVLFVLGAIAIVAVAIYGAYFMEMQAIAERIAAGGAVAKTRHGQIEYTMWGDGPPVMTLHGAGGVARSFAVCVVHTIREASVVQQQAQR